MEYAAPRREGRKKHEGEEEEEEEEEMVGDVATNPMFSSSCSSSSSSPSPSSSNYYGYNKGLIPHPSMGCGAQAYDRLQQQRRQRLWVLGTLESEGEGSRSNEAAHREQDSSFSPRLVGLMDLSSYQTQSSNSDADAGDDTAGGGNNSSAVSGAIDNSGRGGRIIEKEHMFDKVVTPSDVGKLNRLVIPKQHAEKYFPLDSTINEKGLLLSFEDRNGKPWRFRYSYWNSSQSYVMTKGWSRFVKDKRLDAGDIVSFQRGVGEFSKDHLYIDWRRRHPDPLHPSSSSSSSSSLLLQLPPLPPHLGLPLPHTLSLGRPSPHVPLPWNRLLLPTPNPSISTNHMHFHHHNLNYDRTTQDHLLIQLPRNPINNFNYNSSSSYDYSGIGSGSSSGGGGGGAAAAAGTGRSCGDYDNHYYNNFNVVNQQGSGSGSGPGSGFYLRSPSAPQHMDVGVRVGVEQEGQDGDRDVPMVIEDSMVPVVHGKAAAKRVRLFGVNLECPTPEDD